MWIYALMAGILGFIVGADICLLKQARKHKKSYRISIDEEVRKTHRFLLDLDTLEAQFAHPSDRDASD